MRPRSSAPEADHQLDRGGRQHPDSGLHHGPVKRPAPSDPQQEGLDRMLAYDKCAQGARRSIRPRRAWTLDDLRGRSRRRARRFSPPPGALPVDVRRIGNGWGSPCERHGWGRGSIRFMSESRLRSNASSRALDILIRAQGNPSGHGAPFAVEDQPGGAGGHAPDRYYTDDTDPARDARHAASIFPRDRERESYDEWLACPSLRMVVPAGLLVAFDRDGEVKEGGLRRGCNIQTLEV